MFWVLAAGMICLATLAVLWPLGFRRNVTRTPKADETTFYKTQLREIDRDVERGLLPEDEAASARIETARRLIAASARSGSDSPQRESVARRRMAAVVILVVIPLVSLGVYGYVGHPDAGDEPLATRRVEPNSDQAIELAMAKIEARLTSHPDELRGWEVLAPVYMKLGRYDKAVAAYQNVLRLAAPTAATQAAFGEAQLAAARGEVTASSRAAFEAALKLEPQFAMAQFYLALAAEQDGDPAKAAAVYEELAQQANGDAPWMIGLRARLAALRAGGAPTAQPNETNGTFSLDQQSMIEGMVEGLARRLADKGGSVEEWNRLIGAYAVLKQSDKAKAALIDARKSYASDATALGNFDALARRLGIGG